MIDPGVSTRSLLRALAGGRAFAKEGGAGTGVRDGAGTSAQAPRLGTRSQNGTGGAALEAGASHLEVERDWTSGP